MAHRLGTLLVIALVVLFGALSPFAPTVRGQDASDLPPVRVHFTMYATTEEGETVFIPDTLILPAENTIVTITLVNNDPTQMFHTFTINDENGTVALNVPLDPGEERNVTFHVLSLNEVAFNNTSFVPEQENEGIRFYCIPHEAAGMIGGIFIGGPPAAEEGEAGEEQLFLRAYWIGLIGFGATILLIIIAYFLIKSSSRHHADHRDHIRRGLP